MKNLLHKIAHELRLEESGRWALYGLVIGIIAGVGSALFFWMLEHGKHLIMCHLAGYEAPAPYGERLFEAVSCAPFKRWLFFLLPAAGGLISGILVYLFAPEAEGHGTDAMIEAFHYKKGAIRGRVPIIKTLATVAVLSTGGSAGREGPTIQIGAGFGSFLAQKLGLTPRERRIMLIAGAGGGLGAIFRAPLGGALTAMEVLYKEDLETEAIVPTVISSITAYIIFTSIFGHSKIFYLPQYYFKDVRELPFYILLGLLCVPLGAFLCQVLLLYPRQNILSSTCTHHFKASNRWVFGWFTGPFLPSRLRGRMGLDSAGYTGQAGSAHFLRPHIFENCCYLIHYSIRGLWRSFWTYPLHRWDDWWSSRIHSTPFLSTRSNPPGCVRRCWNVSLFCRCCQCSYRIASNV